jgi:hypothetical protein
MKIAARLVWMAVGLSGRSAMVGMVVSRVGVRNLTLPELVAIHLPMGSCRAQLEPVLEGMRKAGVPEE